MTKEKVQELRKNDVVDTDNRGKGLGEAGEGRAREDQWWWKET